MTKSSERYGKIFFLVFVGVLAIACSAYFIGIQNGLREKEGDAVVEVYVNGEALYAYEVDAVLKVNPGMDREAIIESTIDEMLIIQYAREKQIEIADDELNYVLKVYQEHYPEIYRDAVDGYGEEGLKTGIKNRLLMSAALIEIMEEPAYKIDLSADAVWQYLFENGLDPATLNEDEYEEAKKLYVERKEAENKERWIRNARQVAEIIYSEE